MNNLKSNSSSRPCEFVEIVQKFVRNLSVKMDEKLSPSPSEQRRLLRIQALQVTAKTL